MHPSWIQSNHSHHAHNLIHKVRELVELKSKDGKDLDVDERNLLSVAYKNVVGSKRASWRTLSGGFDDADTDMVDKYKKIVEDGLEAVCREVLSLLREHLCKNVQGNEDETKVFYLMCGDYYRYLSEFNATGEADRDDEKKTFPALAEVFYGKVMDVAEKGLNETHHAPRIGAQLQCVLL